METHRRDLVCVTKVGSNWLKISCCITKSNSTYPLTKGKMENFSQIARRYVVRQYEVFFSLKKKKETTHESKVI